VISGASWRTPKLGRFGYLSLQTNLSEGEDTLLPSGETIRGHEFHYFDSTDPGSDCIAQKPNSTRSWTCMHSTDHSAAGYPHLYYWSDPEFAARFLRQAEQYQNTIKR
jgi:cobyrinic acid a,c-diamide synthase